MLHCFDVFDTCITRPCFWPGTVFEMLAHGEGLDHVPGPRRSVFREERIAAEKRARKTTPGGEPTIEEIYKELGSIEACQSIDLGRLMTREIELERSLWIPVPATRAVIERHRQRGDSICFASNMYLPGSLIRERLRAFGFLIDDGELFLSSELRANKESGELFKRILAHYGIEPRQLHHVGDHRVADVKTPRAMGIRVKPYTALHADKYESAALAGKALKENWSSVMAGVCRLRRISAEPQGAHTRSANSVVGPVLVSYVAWILRQAGIDGVKTLQFVSRDGYMLKKIADILIRHWNLPLTTGYLLGSRRAWHHLAVTRPLQKMTWLLEGDKPSIATVCAMLRLDPEEVRARMAPERWTEGQWSAPATRKQLGEFLSALDSLAGDWVVESCRDSSQTGLVREYLAEQGILPGSPSAIIDLGWQGRAHDSLDRITGFPVRGYYLSLNTERPVNQEPWRVCMFPEWFPKNRDSPVPQGIAPDSFMYLFEAFSTEFSGSVSGYRRCGATIQAERGKFPHADLASWGLEKLQEEVIRFAEVAATQLKWVFEQGVPEEHLKGALYRVILEFSKNPTEEEMRFWAEFPYQTTQNSSIWEPLAKPYDFSLRTCWTWLRTGRHPSKRRNHRAVEWKTGSRMLTESTTTHGKLMKQLVRARNLTRAWRNKYQVSSRGGMGALMLEVGSFPLPASCQYF